MGRSWKREELLAALHDALTWETVLRRLALPVDSDARYRVRRRMTQLGVEHRHLEPLPTRRPGRRRSWSDEALRTAVAASRSLAQAIRHLGLVAVGGNYEQIQRRIRELDLDTCHFTSQGWNHGPEYWSPTRLPLNQVLVAGRWTASHRLKLRLFREGLKLPRCELCGWAQQASDGRVPVELDHINGDRNDNRLHNLRILCPNCHSLQPTHRGLNRRTRQKL